MKAEEILAQPARVLTQRQREFYFENGYVHAEGLISREWIARLNAAKDELVEQSRALTESDRDFVLAPAHTATAPRLRRANYAADNHPVIWEFARNSPLTDLAVDLLGPDVKFREAMINFKWAKGGEEIGWHQDTSFPYTNSQPLTTLVSLEDVGPDQGPLMVIPGSHKGEVFDRYEPDGRWAGGIREKDLKRVPLERAVNLTGPAGSISVVHMHVVHGSMRNDSARGRPLLVCGYDPADAFPISALPMVSRYTGEIVRGSPSRYASLDEGRVLLPPDWSKQGYTSVFELQKHESRGGGYYSGKSAREINPSQ